MQRLDTITGFWTYDTCVTDTNNQPDRGEFDHRFGGVGDFEAIVVGRPLVVEGSSNPLVKVEDIGTFDTFRFNDGPQIFDPAGVVREVTVNGVIDPLAEISFSISSGGTNRVDSDQLPPDFASFGWTAGVDFVTFSLEDGSGNRALMSLQSITETP